MFQIYNDTLHYFLISLWKALFPSLTLTWFLKTNNKGRTHNVFIVLFSQWDVRTLSIANKVELDSSITNMQLSSDLEVLTVSYGKTVSFYNPERWVILYCHFPDFIKSLSPHKSYDSRNKEMMVFNSHQRWCQWRATAPH